MREQRTLCGNVPAARKRKNGMDERRDRNHAQTMPASFGSKKRSKS
jgi:hypothetical protein